MYSLEIIWRLQSVEDFPWNGVEVTSRCPAGEDYQYCAVWRWFGDCRVLKFPLEWCAMLVLVKSCITSVGMTSESVHNA